MIHVLRGLTNKEIAQLFDKHPQTIKTHLRNVMAKIGAHNRVEAALHFLQVGYPNGYVPRGVK